MLWGPSQDQTFVVSTLTNTFSDNSKLAYIKKALEFDLYIQYTKGTESPLLIRKEIAVVENLSVFYVDAVKNLSLGTYGEDQISLSATGNYRVSFPLVPMEQLVRISVSAATPGLTPGTVTLLWYGDNPGYQIVL